MPPPKALRMKTGKKKGMKSNATRSPSNNTNRNVHKPSTSQQAAVQEAEESPSLSTLNQQNIDEEQFAIELYWCVQQFENSLESGNLTQKQATNMIKALKTLRSPNQPLIKKRQVMRGSLGDYRAKMAEEEKKYSLTTKQIKFTDSSSSNAKAKKSYFIKKSALLQSGGDFKFNFPIDEIEQLNISDEKCVEPKEDDKSGQLKDDENEQLKDDEGGQLKDDENEQLKDDEGGQLKDDKSEQLKDDGGDNSKKESTENKNSEQKSGAEGNDNNLQNFKYIPSGNTFKFNFDVKKR